MEQMLSVNWEQLSDSYLADWKVEYLVYWLVRLMKELQMADLSEQRAAKLVEKKVAQKELMLVVLLDLLGEHLVDHLADHWGKKWVA